MSRDLMENRNLTDFFYRIFVWGRQICDDSSTDEPAGRLALVELVGNNRVLDQKLERNDL